MIYYYSYILIAPAADLESIHDNDVRFMFLRDTITS